MPAKQDGGGAVLAVGLVVESFYVLKQCAPIIISGHSITRHLKESYLPSSR